MLQTCQLASSNDVVRGTKVCQSDVSESIRKLQEDVSQLNKSYDELYTTVNMWQRERQERQLRMEQLTARLSALEQQHACFAQEKT